MDSPIRILLKTQISNLTGNEFQDFIDQLFLSHYGSEKYHPTRHTRDQGCDGIVNNDTVVACYGYDNADKTAILKKVQDDFLKYSNTWHGDFPLWLFIINKDVPAYLIKEVSGLQPNSFPKGIKQLIEIIETGLSPSRRHYIYDYLNIPKALYKFLPQEFWSFVETVEPRAFSVNKGDNALKKKFHSIVPLTWDHIIYGADTQRDLYTGLIKALTKHGDGTPRFIAITGEPLAGKSTLMRRIGYDLATEPRSRTVLHVYKGRNAPIIWDNLEKYYEIENKKTFILVDDIFENDNAFTAMLRFFSKNVDEQPDVTILGTAVSNDRLKRRLNDIKRIGLKSHSENLELTDNEKHQILTNLDIDELSIDSRAHEKLFANNKFYSFMMHATLLSQGKDNPIIECGVYSESVEEWRLLDLKRHQPRLFEAFKYVCFSHKHKLSFPISLLKEVEKRSFRDILDLRGRQDWLFDITNQYSDSQTVESAHWYLADIYWDVYVQHVSAQILVAEMLSSVSTGNYREALYILHLFRVLIENQTNLDLKSILTEHIVEIKQQYTTLGVDAMCIWGRIYNSLQMDQEEADCWNIAKAKTPVNVADLRVLIPLIEKEDPERALRLFQEWLQKKPENGTLQVAYFEFLSNNAEHFAKEIETEINQDNKLMENIGDFWDSTQSYIKFILNHSPGHGKFMLDFNLLM